ncbi:MAG: tetratricopeptide repeat protein, partial [Anaerolineae bacterium]|nr:tetratricopeptide repeat protein [Anaerolineae bacterium]
TQIWLEHHDDDVQVRSTYLNLVKEKGQAQQIAEALDSTQIWLEHHDDDVQVRSTYLNLVKEKGQAQQIAEALDSTQIWLEHHDDDVQVRSDYLNLVKEKGQAQQIAEALDSTQIWLEHHDDDVQVRSTYLNLVKEKGQAQQVTEAIDNTRRWLKKPNIKSHPQINIDLGTLFYKKGQFDEAAECLEKGVTQWKNNIPARVTFAWCLFELSDEEKALNQLNHADLLAKKYETKFRNFTLHNLGVFYQKQARYEKALSCFEEAIELAPDRYGSYIELGKTLIMFRRYKKAIKPLEQAVTLLDPIGNAEIIANVHQLIGEAKAHIAE